MAYFASGLAALSPEENAGTDMEGGWVGLISLGTVTK
jgi:hypothetical protein